MLVILYGVDDAELGNVLSSNPDPSLVVVWIHGSSDTTFSHETTSRLAYPASQHVLRFTINYATTTNQNWFNWGVKNLKI